MSTNATPAPQTEVSKILGTLFTMGTAAAAIFVKNVNHQATASSIISVLNALLPELEGML